jgi:hypothetical protein
MRRSLPFVLFAVAAVTALWLSAQPDRGRPSAARQNAENAADVSAAPGSWPPPTGNELPKRELPELHLKQGKGGPVGVAEPTRSPGGGVEDLPAPRIGEGTAADLHVVHVNDARDPQQRTTGGTGRSAPPIPVIAGVAAPAPPASDPAPTPDDGTPDGSSGGQLPPGDNPPPNSVDLGALPPDVARQDLQRRENNKSFIPVAAPPETVAP